MASGNEEKKCGKTPQKIPDALHTRGHLLDVVMRQRLALFLTTRSEMGPKDDVL